MTPSAKVPPVPARITRPRLYEQIVKELLGHMRTHQLGPGDRLPAERELAHALGVSRASLAQALIALEVVGVVQVRHGEGAVLIRRPQTEDDLVAAIREHQENMPAVIDARSALEAKLAALAAERRTEDEMAAIDAALDRMTQEVAAQERALDGDQAFHEAVTQAAHSPMLARMMAEIRELILATRIKSLSQPGRPAASLAKHREIADAIRRGDANAAAIAMTQHIDAVSQA